MEEAGGMRGFIDQMRECGEVIEYEDRVAAEYRGMQTGARDRQGALVS